MFTKCVIVEHLASDYFHFCFAIFFIMMGKCVINHFPLTNDLLLSLNWQKNVTSATQLISQSLSLRILHRFVSCSSMEHKLLMKTSKKISLHFYAHEFWAFTRTLHIVEQ